MPLVPEFVCKYGTGNAGCLAAGVLLGLSSTFAVAEENRRQDRRRYKGGIYAY
jgi:hypothetical protein